MSKRIITYGLHIEENLGCPSLLLSFYELLKEIYGDDFQMLNLQEGPVSPEAVAGMPFQTLSVRPYRAKEYFKTFLGSSRKASNEKIFSESTTEISLSEAFSLTSGADAVVNLFGICFCDNFPSDSALLPLVPLYAMLRFPLSAAAKRYHVLSIKNTASYGPIKTKYTRGIAQIAERYLFDRMVAREKQSLQAMRGAGVSEKIMLAPDTANLMPYSKDVHFDRPTVGISTSHQIVRQWKSAEEYTQCIARLCFHIGKTYPVDILLIPNEYPSSNPYHDIDVSEDILELLRELGGDAAILDVRSMNGTQIKNAIAACEVLVASRYHACVAALSSGVPVMVLGWHYKYEELLQWYGQQEWLLSQNDCDKDRLIEMFDQFWARHNALREEIQERYPAVREAVIQTGRQMFDTE